MNTDVKPPMTATDFELRARDNVIVGDFTIMVEGNQVVLDEQAWGEERKQCITIPRDVFNKLIEWYTTGVVPAEDAASRTPPKK